MAISGTHFNFPNQTAFYKGKVRDVYSIGDDLLVMIASDRISAFDVVLPRAIPFKGQVLNQIAAHMLEATSDVVPNWRMASPDPNITIGYRCEPFKVEMVIRGYLTGHAWRTYNSGLRVLCGVTLPEGLKEHDRLPEPIITPTTKATTRTSTTLKLRLFTQASITSHRANSFTTALLLTSTLHTRAVELR